MLAIEGPVWLPPASPLGELFPATTGEPVPIAFLGSTAETAAPGDEPHHQMSDTPGRLSRALPLFLAEQIRFQGEAQIRTIIPWLEGDTPAFVLGGVAWANDDAAQHGRTGNPACDYVVVTHLKTAGEPWIIELRLIRTIDAKLLGTAMGRFSAAHPETAFLQLAQDLLGLLVEHAGLVRQKAPPQYMVPPAANFPYYLLRLEQMLAVRCAAREGIPPIFLNGVREIIDGNLQLCLNQPANPVVRVLLAQTLLRLNKVEPSAVAEYREKIQLLQKEKQLPQPARGVIETALREIYP